MALAQLNLHQAAFLVRLRQLPNPEHRKEMKADLFRIVKDSFGIPHEHKLRVEVDSASSPDFLILRRNTDNSTYDLAADGKWVGAVRPDVAPAPQQREFRVMWEIDVFSADGPEQAAKQVFDTYFQSGHSATHFTVTDNRTGEATELDVDD